MTVRMATSKLHSLIAQHLQPAYKFANGTREKVANFANHNIGSFCAPFILAGAVYGAYQGKQFLDQCPQQPVQWLPVYTVVGAVAGIVAGEVSAMAVFSPLKTVAGAFGLYAIVKGSAYVETLNAKRAATVK